MVLPRAARNALPVSPADCDCEFRTTSCSQSRAINGLKSGHVSADLTLNIGKIQGGRLTNIVPDACTVEGEIRGGEHAAALDCLRVTEQAFQRACDEFGACLCFSSKCRVTAYQTPEDAPVVSRYVRACEAYGIKAETVRTFGGSDNNILAQRGISGVVIASAMHNCHSSAEFTTIDELVQLAEMLTHLMLT